MKEDQEFKKIMKDALEEHITQPSLSFSKNVMSEVKRTSTHEAFNGKSFIMVFAVIVVSVFLLLIFQPEENMSILVNGYQDILNKWHAVKFPKTVGYGLISILALLIVQIRLLNSGEIKN